MGRDYEEPAAECVVWVARSDQERGLMGELKAVQRREQRKRTKKEAGEDFINEDEDVWEPIKSST